MSVCKAINNEIIINIWTHTKDLLLIYIFSLDLALHASRGNRKNEKNFVRAHNSHMFSCGKFHYDHFLRRPKLKTSHTRKTHYSQRTKEKLYQTELLQFFLPFHSDKAGSYIAKEIFCFIQKPKIPLHIRFNCTNFF